MKLKADLEESVDLLQLISLKKVQLSDILGIFFDTFSNSLRNASEHNP